MNLKDEHIKINFYLWSTLKSHTAQRKSSLINIQNLIQLWILSLFSFSNIKSSCKFNKAHVIIQYCKNKKLFAISIKYLYLKYFKQYFKKPCMICNLNHKTIKFLHVENWKSKHMKRLQCCLLKYNLKKK